jgi:hypothetical protein
MSWCLVGSEMCIRDSLNPRFVAHSVKELHDWLLAHA